VRVAAAAAVVVVLVVAGCGGGGSHGKAIAKYIDEVNAIELQLRKPLDRIAKTNLRFSTKHIHRTQVQTARARRTLETLDRRLHALDAPRDARTLRARLLELVDAEVALAREVERLALFLPEFDAAVRPVAPAQRRLNAALRAAKTPAAQARALERYRRDLAAPLAKLRALDAPAVTAPTRDTEVATLTRVRATAAALAAALRANRLQQLPTLERRFAVASRSGETITPQRARIDAIRGYDRRVRSLVRLAARVQRERDRLQRSL
jgi:hypothetical protein